MSEGPASQALDALGEPIGRLVDKTLEGSQEAREALVKRQDTRSLAPLLLALQNNDRDVRMVAADVLGELNHVEAVDPLISMAQSWNPGERMVATLALMKLQRGRGRIVSGLL